MQLSLRCFWSLLSGARPPSVPYGAQLNIIIFAFQTFETRTQRGTWHSERPFILCDRVSLLPAGLGGHLKDFSVVLPGLCPPTRPAPFKLNSKQCLRSFRVSSKGCGSKSCPKEQPPSALQMEGLQNGGSPDGKCVFSHAKQ